MEFRILGSLEVVENGRCVPIRAGNDRALLALLLLHANDVVSSERLIDELWADGTPQSAPKIVQNAVLRLRRALGNGRLETRDGGYRLEVAENELDVAQFERLLADDRARAALELWRGPPLPELSTYPFAEEAARRLEELRLAALERRVDEDLAAGRGGALIPELEALTAEHPFRERFQAQLMRALYADGRQAEALEAYRRTRRTLSEELGLEPGPELQELERAILNHDLELELLRAPPPTRSHGRRTWLLLAAAAVLAGIAAIAAFITTRGGGGGAVVPPPNSVAVIDPARSRIVAAIPVGQYPGAIAVGTSGVWVANAGDETVSRIDPKRLVVTKTYGVGGAAADIALDTGGAWVVTGLDHTLVRIDARRGVGPVLPLPATPSGTSSVAVGGGWVWVGSENVLRIDPTAGTIRQAHGCCRSYDLAYGYGAAWVAGRDEVVTKLGPESLRVVASQHVGELELRLALGYGSVWTAGTTNFNASRLSAVWKLDPMTALPSAGFPVGQHPTRGVNYTVSIAVGAGGIWVAPANTRDLVRLDPETGRETARLHLDRQPGGIAVGAGRVWVTLQ